jgi:hypothetical protein
VTVFMTFAMYKLKHPPILAQGNDQTYSNFSAEKKLFAAVCFVPLADLSTVYLSSSVTAVEIHATDCLTGSH